MNVVILGGGVSGISAAFLLLQKSSDPDLKVDLIEKRSFVGGLCHTIDMEGFRFDLGPHNIHSTDVWFDELMRALLGEQYRQRSYKAQVVFRDRFVPYPMEGIDVLKGIPLGTSLSCASSFLWSRVESLFHKWNDDSFQSFIVNRFGRKMYNIFFGPFTEKTWGVPGSELSSDLGKQRVGVFTLWDLFKRTVLGIKPNASITGEEDPFLNQRTYYPDNGSGDVISALLAPCLRDPRFRLHSSTEVRAIEPDQEGYLVHAGDLELKSDYLLSSIALTDLLQMLQLPDPGLSYISTRFILLSLAQESVFGDTPWVYFSDNKTLFNRVSEPRNMSKLMAPPGKTSLCVEFTTTGIDKIWKASEGTILDWTISGLKQYGLLKPDTIENCRVIDWENTYPLRRVDYKASVASAFHGLGRHPRIIPFGRLGRFEYLNMDHCILDARKVVTELTKRIDNNQTTGHL
ncbi:MAG: NAD(P)-binding protein [Candidatus Fermentibacteraceae bacterium]